MKKFILSILFFIFTFSTLFIWNKSYAICEKTHWHIQKIPVYIQTDKNNSPLMKKAFNRWQSEAGDRIKFVYVSKEAAKIKVYFTDKVDGSDGPLGWYKLTTSGSTITSAQIKIATNSKKKYSTNEIYSTMLHEVGHVLGLPELERKKSSIMNMPIPEDKDLQSYDVRDLYKVYKWSYSRRNLDK